MPIPVITPISPIAIDALVIGTYVDRLSYPKTNVAIVSDINATFTVLTLGTIQVADAKHALYTPPNIQGVYVVRVADAANPAQYRDLVVAVKSVMQSYWEWRTPATTGSDLDIFEPEEGPEQAISRSGYRGRYDTGSEDTGYDEFMEMWQFYKDHHLTRKSFVVYDPTVNKRSLYLTDSEFEWHANHPQSYYWKFKIKEAYPYGLG